MSVDPGAWGVAAAAISLLGHPFTWWLARRKNTADAELTEAQAEQVRAEIWTKLQTALTDELGRQRAAAEQDRKEAHGEIERLRGELADVATRLKTVELALIEKSAKLRATEIERDRLREREAALTAEVAALQAQVVACRACTITTTPGGTP